MPHEYQRTPFNTSLPVYVTGLVCSASHPGARDIGFLTMKWQVMQVSNGVITGFIGTGTPVYAVEAGTVVYVNRTTTCYDNRNPATLCPEAHGVAVKGSDGYYTLYAHVYPNSALRIGSTVQPGTWLGNIDNSGNTTGPHLHFARFTPNTNDRNFAQNGTCDWTMRGLVPSNFNGWRQQPNGAWYYFVNGKPVTGWTGTLSNGVNYQLSTTTGAWTGWAFFQGQYWFWNGTSWESRGTQAPLSIKSTKAAQSRNKPSQPPQVKRTSRVTRVTKVAMATKVAKASKVTKVTKVAKVTKAAKVTKVAKVTKATKVAQTSQGSRTLGGGKSSSVKVNKKR